MTTDAPLRFGLVGLGPGAMNLLPGFAHNPHVVLTAAADVREDAVTAFAKDYQIEGFNSAEEMCKSANIDAVYVVTPTPFHAEYAIAAARHGKHIITTKPMAVSMEECERMVAAADENNVRLVCGHTQSLLFPVRKLAELVWSGEFGNVGMLQSWNYTDWIYRPRRPWELDSTVGGGVVYRQSPHHIDILRLIHGGKVRSVRAMVLALDPSRNAPGAFSVWMQFEDGTPGTIVYSGYGHFNTNEITWGPELRLRAPASARTPEQEEAAKNAMGYVAGRSAGTRAPTEEAPFTTFGLTLVSCEKADIRQSPQGIWVYTEEGRREIVLPPDEARGEAEFEELYQAVTNNVPPLHDGRWGVATHEITLAIMESARENKEIVLTRQTEVPAERRKAAIAQP